MTRNTPPDTSHFISDKEAQKARVADKRQRVLSWLSSESYSTSEILQMLLGLSRPQAYQTLKKMERDGLVRLETVERGLQGKNTIWVITPHGATMAADPDAERFEVDYYEAGRVSPLTITHSIDCQRARLAAAASGWREWVSEKQCRSRAAAEEPDMSKRVKWVKVPDAIATDPAGAIVAVELERTAKTPKRYAGIVAEYLQMMHAQVIHRVDYVCPDPVLVPRLARIFQEVKTVKIKGQDVQITPAILSRFRFTALANWPQPKEKKA